jgi:hypothetical protein
MRTALYVVGGLAIIAFFVVRQRRSDRYRERSLLLPLALGLYGLANFAARGGTIASRWPRSSCLG